MVYMRNNRVRVNSRHPQAQAICDRCGWRYNHVDLQWQFQWVGPTQQNLRLLVCPTCIDKPNETLRVYNVGADPLPIKDPRPDNVDTTSHLYLAPAVYLNGNVTLHIDSLASTDNGLLSFALWLNPLAPTNGVSAPIFVSDAGSNYSPLSRYVYELSPTVTRTFNGQVSNSSGMAFVSTEAEVDCAPLSTWVCLLGSFDATRGIAKLYNGNTDITDAAAYDASGVPFTIATNGLTLDLFSDGFGANFVGNIADLRFMPGVSLLDDDGLIPVATRRLFIDGSGYPVDPLTATAALGIPAVLLSGDATTWPVNQGSGGHVTVGGDIVDSLITPSGWSG